MTERDHTHRGTAKKRLRQPPVVEMRIPKRKFDVNAWIGSFAEREVEREVHARADKPAAETDRHEQSRGDPATPAEASPERT